MASLTTVRLNRGDSSSWGFRLQGGKDFGTPLVIQKVNGGSPAERAGLTAGDAVIKINNVDVYNLLHKDAQDVIVRSGSNFDMVIQRGGSTWKPSVVPTGTYPKPSPSINNVSAVTTTSLAANQRENIGAIGTGHNVSARPFNTQVNGAVNGGPQLVNKQYNSPLKLYSEDAIAESLSAQTEVLSTGALGVNFKKNEKDYDATNSAVYRMLQEAENDKDGNDTVIQFDNYMSQTQPTGGRSIVSPRPTTPSYETIQNQKSTASESATLCSDCERVIVGVFVRIKDKNLHVECFKCATCGSSLKNVGYYNINNKLYCDIHAKAAAIAINNPSAIPITISPGSKAPASAISAALSSHSYPSSPLSAKAPSYTPSYQTSNFSGPKPFSSVSAPLSPGGSFPRAAPLSPQANYNKAPLSPSAPSYGSYSPSSTGRCTNITWPPTQEDTEVPTACPLFYPPPSKVEAEIEKKLAIKKQSKFESEYFTEESELMDETMSSYSEELTVSGRRSTTECIDILSETLDMQKLVENAIKASPQQIFPPLHIEETSEIKSKGDSSYDVNRPAEFDSNTTECQLTSKVENAVPQKWESSLTQAARTTAPDSSTFSRIPPRHSASPMASALAIAPAQPFNSVSHRDLEPVPFPEQTEPYFPPEHPIIPLEKADTKENKKEELPPIPKPYSPFTKALEIAPDRPFTPIGCKPAPPPVKKKPKDPLDKLLEELPKPAEILDMRCALTTAPERPYTPHLTDYCASSCDKHQKTQNIDRSQLMKPLKPEELPASFKMNVKEPKPPSYYAPSVIEEIINTDHQESCSALEKKETIIVEKETLQAAQTSQPIITTSQEPQPTNYAPMFQGFTCSFKNKTDHSQFSVEVSTTPPVLSPPPKPQIPISYIATVEQKPTIITREQVVQESTAQQQTTTSRENIKYEVSKGETKLQKVQKQAEEIIQIKPLPVTALLRKAEALPSYQVDIQAAAESELRIMERKRKAEERLQYQKREREQQNIQPSQGYIIQEQKENQSREQESQSDSVELKQQSTKQAPLKPERYHHTKPIITVEPSDTDNVTEKVNFQPVPYENPSTLTFSPRPRSMTPSMINKAPALLPYYQDNLVAHFHAPVSASVLDPTTPDVSRSPTPHHLHLEVRSRSPSPFPTKASQDRAKSPAQGPPPNPLHSSKPLPSPQESRLQQAKENLKTYIPEYKSHRDIMENNKGVDFNKSGDEIQQNTISEVSQNVAYPLTNDKNQFSIQTGNVHQIVQSSQQQQLQVTDTQMHQTQIYNNDNVSSKIDISEKSNLEQLAASRQSQSQYTEKSTDGLTQIQRKKVVTEEYEQSHKETNIQIEKNVTTKYPFTKVNVPAVEPPNVQSIHITNPHHIKTREGISSHEIAQRLEAQNVVHTSQEASETEPIKVSQPENQAQTSSDPTITSQSQPVPPPPPIRRVYTPGSLAPVKHVTPLGACQKPSHNITKPNVPKPDVGAGAGRQSAGITAAPKRGRGLLNAAALPGSRVPLCGHCHGQIRGPFITALGKIWCPQHFICATPSCRRHLQDVGFVEENGQLYCEYCFEQYLAPPCSKCHGKIKADCLKAIGKNFHPECFNCVYCGKLFGNSPFFLEDGNPYCDADWNELFTTKCYACGFPVEAGDRWVEALSNNYHSQCFNCTMCKKNLEGQSFFAKGGRPFCKNHAR